MTDLAVTTEAPGGAEPRCPFVGLAPYGPQDVEWFFGRESDSQLIADNLIAFELTLLYGPSGVGKTSALSAGVLTQLRRLAEIESARGRQPFITVVHRNWHAEPIAALNGAIDDAVADQRADPCDPPPADLPLAERLADWSRRCGASLYIVLDQFEEYFLYHPDPEDPATLELAHAIGAHGDGAHFLIAIREDALAKLDVFEGLIPNLFENNYRLEHLKTADAQNAIGAAVDHWNDVYGEDAPVEIEPTLVEEILAEVTTGNAALSPAGVGRAESATTDPAIETAQLQLVLTRLWKAEIEAGERVLSPDALRRHGGAEAVIRTHLGESMGQLSSSEQEIVLDVFSQLVTPSGSKIAHTAEDLASYSGIEVEDLWPVLERLAAGDLRILRPVAPAQGATRYEIFHDVLAGPILRWVAVRREQLRVEEARSEQAAEVAKAREAASRERRRRILVTITALTAVLVCVVTVAAVLLWQRSERERRAGVSRDLAAEALEQLGEDPVAATELALDAYTESETDLAIQALRESVPALSVESVLAGHGAAVTSVSFSPDGSTVATGSDDGTARVWDAATGEELLVLRHGGQVKGVQYDAVGATLATFADTGTVRIWDAATGTESIAIVTTPEVLTNVVMNPPGRVVATSGSSDVVEIWDATTGARLESLPHDGAGRIHGLAMAEYGDQEILVTGDSTGTLRVWDMDNWEILAMVTGARSVSSLDLTPDGELVLVGSDRRVETLAWPWVQNRENPVDGGAPWILLPPDGQNTSRAGPIATDPTGTYLASTGDRLVNIWTTELLLELDPGDSGSNQVLLTEQTGAVFDTEFSPDGLFVATATGDGRVGLWHAETGALLREYRGHEGAVNAIAFSPENRVVSASNDWTARIWSTPVGIAYRGHTAAVTDVDVAGTLLVSSGLDGLILGHDLNSAELLWSLPEGDEPVRPQFAAELSDDGGLLATGDSSGVRVWSLASGEPAIERGWPTAEIPADLRFSPDGKTLAVSSREGAVHLWVWEELRPIRSLIAHRAWSTADFSADGSLIATGGRDGSVRIWNVATGQELRRLEEDNEVAHLGGVNSVSFTADGQTLLSSGEDRVVRVWDVESGETLHTLERHETPVMSAALDDEEERIVSGDEAGNVAIWDLESGSLLWLEPKHASFAQAVGFTEDGEVISGGGDGLVLGFPCLTCMSDDDLVSFVDQRLQGISDATSAENDGYFDVLGPGVCAPKPDDPNSFDELTSVSCDQEHHYEFFAALVLPGRSEGDAGYQVLVSDVQGVCEADVEAYVGGPLPGDLEVRVVATDDGEESANRSVLCAVSTADGTPKIGSVPARAANTWDGIATRCPGVLETAHPERWAARFEAWKARHRRWRELGTGPRVLVFGDERLEVDVRGSYTVEPPTRGFGCRNQRTIFV